MVYPWLGEARHNLPNVRYRCPVDGIGCWMGWGLLTGVVGEGGVASLVSLPVFTVLGCGPGQVDQYMIGGS